MKYDGLISDIEKMSGLLLQSIRPGAEITILSVDKERASLVLRTKTDEKKSRPLNELQLLWAELTRLPAVHVDEALHGSGTSRNQPETVLANLPYVEWLKIDGKKHIAYVGKETHPYGTLKEMSTSDAVRVKALLHANEALPTALVVTDNPKQTIDHLAKICPGSSKSIAIGTYLFVTANSRIIVLLSQSTTIDEGTYIIINGKHHGICQTICINGTKYGVLSSPPLRLCIRQQ